MASIDDLKEQIDLNDLAELLDMKRDGKINGNRHAVYFSPARKEKNASLSVCHDGKGWKDHTTGNGGSCIDLVMYAGRASNVHEAADWLHREFNIPKDRPAPGQQIEKSKTDWIADKCLQKPDDSRAYLQDQRKISKKTVDYAIKSKTVGFSNYTNPAIDPGNKFHGGGAVAFICKNLHSRTVDAVEYRYFDAALNGNVKNHCHGSKGPAFWCINPGNLKAAHTVVLVESPINALSVESAIAEVKYMKGWTAMAVMGASNLDQKDWSVLRGKRVIVAMDNDKPMEDGPKAGYCAGDLAAWAIHEALLEKGIPCLLVDHNKWEGLNDLNDILKEKGDETLREWLQEYQNWLIPGFSGKAQDGEEKLTSGKGRVYLPTHDYTKYWQFRTQEDFTTYFKEVTEKDADGNETKRLVNEDLCGFRVAALSRIKVQSANATMTGEMDYQPNVVFAPSIQSARHGNKLIRKVFTDEQLYNPERWRGFGGAIYKPAQFSRMLNILERATHIGGRDAVNFVGIAWKDGKPVLNEGPDCYFTDPEKQCPYHNLSFPSGPKSNAGVVIEAYRKTFGHNAALMILSWGLGAHIKAFLGFWPHLVIQGDKNSGKSVLCNRLERTIGFTMFSGQNLQTEYRIVTSVSHTYHPIGWEELSARRQDIIDKAVSILQETYQYTISRRGADLTEFVQSAPVLLAGEDVPVQSLLGKVIKVDLAEKGDLMPESLPVFPVREWLQFLAGYSKNQVNAIYERCRQFCITKCSANADDKGASRIINNYAALATAWALLTEFAGIDSEESTLRHDLLTAMNTHVLETRAEREPWVWILDIVFGEIDSGTYNRPFKFERQGDDTLLFIRTSHMMQHLSQTPALKSKFDAMPVKSDRVLKRQLVKAGVITKENDDKERSINQRRCAHMSGLSLNKLEEYGLSPVLPEEIPEHF